MKRFTLVLLILTTIFFNACSSKKVFEPTEVKGNWNYYGDIDEKIIDISSTAALLENRKVLIGAKTIDVKVPENDMLLGYSDGWVISADMNGKLTLQFFSDKSDNDKQGSGWAIETDKNGKSSLQFFSDKTIIKTFNLKRTIATASIKDDILAVLFANNEMALYSISTQKLLLKEQGNAPIVVNSKITSPHFIDNIVLFFTLDGKVVIIDTKRNKKIRTVIISSDNYFNNVIYFNVLENKIIAATGNKILSISEKEIRLKYDIRAVSNDSKNIYVATKQGEIISLTSDLQQNKKVKFPFANFLGLIIAQDKIYALEKDGYIIELSKDLQTYNIYDVDIDEGYVFIANKVFYINDEYIATQK